MKSPDRMTAQEWRATFSLSSLFALRMLGLFIILPVFAVHAGDLRGGGDQTLVGVALGAYGLTQGLLQIPFGMASDRYGRKRVIVAGLLIFAAGSFLAAVANDIWLVILGRILQGAGAISSAVVAFAADLTREEHRTKAMAVIGASIGLVFALSLVTAPLLYRLIGMGGIFALTGLLSLAAIWVTLKVVPPEPGGIVDTTRRVQPGRLRGVLRNADLLRLNLGIFTLHALQMAMFVVVPVALVSAGLDVERHWRVYLPVVLLSFALMLPPIFYAERRGKMRGMFLGSIAVLGAVQLGFFAAGPHLWQLAALLLVFFVVFNVLEATLPSLVTRLAPVNARGTAIGVYNTTQSLGLFVGGAAGGWLAQHWQEPAVFVFGMALAALWLLVAAGMHFPGTAVTRRFELAEGVDLASLRERLVRLRGIREVVVLADQRAALLTFYPDSWDEQAAMAIMGGRT